MSGAYPYLVQHIYSEKHHVVRDRPGYRPGETTCCGHDPHNGNYRERSKTIRDAVKEKTLCKICLMSDEAYEVIAENLERLEEFQPPA